MLMLITPSRFPRIVRRGFTIVELLIVIVVIAILAAITIVAYNGIQQRATNAAIIDTASKSLRSIQSYLAANSSYPMSANGSACITTTSGCFSTGAVGAIGSFDSNMGTLVNLPRSVPTSGADHYGVYVTYQSNFTYNTVVQPLFMVYFLAGVNQKCGLANVTNWAWPDTISSGVGYTTGNIDASGKTLCWISIPGPTS